MHKHVAFLLPDMGSGGAERLTIDLVQGFLARGARVDLVLQRATGELLDLLPAGVRIVDLNAPKIRQAYKPLREYLRRERPDALIAAMWPLTVLAIAAAARLPQRPRVVVSDHCRLTEQYAGQPMTLAMLRATASLFYRFADAIVAVSTGVADEIVALQGPGAAPVKTIYNPVPEPLRSGVSPDTLWQGQPGKRILSVGTLKAQKNYALLIAAFAKLPATVHPPVLAIVGSGPLEAALAAQAAALGVADRVLLPGFTRTPGDWYAGADAFALVSNYEGFGNVLVEAMHAGLPIVATDCPSGPAEVLGEGRWGTLVPCGDVDALATALQAVLESTVDGDAQRMRAREFSVSRAVDSYDRTVFPLTMDGRRHSGQRTVTALGRSTQ